MPEFSQSSLQQLSTCHPDLQTLFKEVIKEFDCKILEGHRDRKAQEKAFAEGKSQLQWPNGKHNQMPSLAVDVAPYPVDWKDTGRFYFFAGYVMGMANKLFHEGKMAHRLRYGGDWNGNTQIKDNSFNDLVHYELII